jgi:signal transduction histidine kinase
VSIRKTLLVAFLGVSLLSALLLATLAFVQASAAMQTEIERNLAVQAIVTSTEIDKMMFERLQNAVTWSRLDIMQDVQIGDVDKRLSQFLSDLQTGYGDVYLNLACIGVKGRIVSSSDASAIGLSMQSQPPWISASLSGTEVQIEQPAAFGANGIVMSVALRSAYAGGKLGELRLRLDWSRISDILDQAASDDGRLLAVLDRDGRLIAASKGLRTRGLLLGSTLSSWRPTTGVNGVIVRPGEPISSSDVIVGSAVSLSHANLAGFGWTTLVIQPLAMAMAPVHRMGLIFLGYLILVMLLTVLVAHWVSREIARPIIALTGFARGYMRNKVLQVPATPEGGEVGELTQAFVKMVRDIDLSQQNLVRASKLAVVGEMSSIIAHEVRTPLGILRTSAQMLKRESGISAQGKEMLGFIDTETERLNRLVSAMLDTARTRIPIYTLVDMHELVRRCIAMLATQAAGKEITVEVSLLAMHAVIRSDEEQMTQVLLNLLMNAMQVLNPGGRIEVATADDGDDLRIEIGDDGPGLALAERARVFEAFFFRREGGIGLGLAIVQQIVNSNGGEISASESAMGGALFKLRLPREQTGPQ